MIQKQLLKLFLIFTLIVLWGCAAFNRDNTPALNYVEKKLWPEKAVARAIAFPVIFPVGVAAASIDAFIIHPAYVVDDAAEDTDDLLWSRIDWETEYVTECAALPWRAIFTPVIFTGSFLGRSMFDFPKRADRLRYVNRKEENITTETQDINYENLKKAHEIMNSEDYVNSLSMLDQISFEKLPDQGKYVHNYILLEASWKTKDLRRLQNLDLYYLSLNPYQKEIKSIFEEMMNTDDPMFRWWACSFMMQSYDFSTDERLKAGSKAISDSEPIIRYNALFVLKHRYQSNIRQLLWDDITRISKEDPHPMIRNYAALILKTSKKDGSVSKY